MDAFLDQHGATGLLLRDNLPPGRLDEVLRTQADQREKPDEETPHRVLLHNDDVTPMEFVVQVLVAVFELSTARATWVMLRAHFAGMATVGVMPRRQAAERIDAAQAMSSRAGWRLRFTSEPVG